MLIESAFYYYRTIWRHHRRLELVLQIANSNSGHRLNSDENRCGSILESLLISFSLVVHLADALKRIEIPDVCYPPEEKKKQKKKDTENFRTIK